MNFVLPFISSMILLLSTINVAYGRALDTEETDDPSEVPSVFKLQSRKTGCVSGDCNDGEGTLNYQTGSQYVGEFQSGQRNGVGEYTWPSQITKDGKVESSETTSYVGRFRNGFKHGQGELKWRNGNIYTGDFTDNLIHGYGTKVYADGRTYEGNWEEGQREGFGKLTLTDGSHYIGQYRNNQKHDETGNALFMKSNGSRWFVKYTDGKLTESAKISLADWAVKED